MNSYILKKSYTILELIFVIVIIASLASFALPKFYNTKIMANIVVVKQDIATVVSSIQTHYLIKGNINKITDSIDLDKSVWNIEDKKITFKDGVNNCITIEIRTSSIKSILVEISPEAGNLCKKLNEAGVVDKTYPLI
ncbi:MAG: prepilin-type N-terminal cleavage/methylation domain-containing protein [Campylobacterales bacterium]|nr:prepilin-type N-terminal cleavage/methylation domain-containing protein [Campylobacterales bacterium]